MEYRRLGKAGVKVSELAMGCNEFGWFIDEKASERVVHYALDKGINFFDTSPIYGDLTSEQFLGKALKGRRSQAVIATKFGSKFGKYAPIPPGWEGPNDYGGSRYHIMKAVDGSLQRLQTDHIDVYYMHVPDATTPIEETLRTLDDLIHMGKVRYIACSNFEPHQLYQAMETSAKLNLESFSVIQHRYNLIDRSIEKQLLPFCRTYGVGLIPYTPLHCGLLTGIFKRGQGVPPGSRYDGKPERMKIEMGEDFLSARNFDILEKLEGFTRERNHTMAELAIAWLLSHEFVPAVIAGSDKPEFIDANLKGAEWKLTPNEITQISEMIA